MTSVDQEAAILDRAREELEAQGFEVIVQPGPFSLPSFLKNLRPDAVAHRGSDHLVIEVVSRAAPTQAKLRLIRHALAEHTDWKLRTIWTSGSTVPRSPKPPTAASVSTTLAEIDRLLEADLLKPAFLIAWACLEALGRLLIPTALEKPQTPRRLIEQLAETGLLERREAADLRKLAEVRNRLIHGELDVPVAEDQLIEIRDVLWKLHDIAAAKSL